MKAIFPLSGARIQNKEVLPPKVKYPFRQGRARNLTVMSRVSVLLFTARITVMILFFLH